MAGPGDDGDKEGDAAEDSNENDSEEARGRSGSSSTSSSSSSSPSGLVATVFFLPPAEAVALQRAQGLPGWAPPTLTIGVPASRPSSSSPASPSSSSILLSSASPQTSRAAKAVTGLVLPRPDFVVFRYRVPDPNFAGSPAAATCYATAATNQPIRRTTSGGMGSFTPQLFGCGSHSSLAAFAASLGDPESLCGGAVLI